MLQCVAVCCSVLQCVAVCCSILQCVAVRCSVLQYIAECSSPNLGGARGREANHGGYGSPPEVMGWRHDS